MIKILYCHIIALLLLCLPACNTMDDDRIPSFPVYINLASPDMWNTYGVAGYGDNKIFIKSLLEPRNFPYTEKTMTGYGGVLLVCGVNPYTLEAGVPMAYDLSCPVEASPEVRVRMQPVGLSAEAVCPKCGSHYDVLEQGGAPVKDSGPAYAQRLALRRFDCREGVYGGFLIINY